jgi:intracellular sulfur oxidation DsrE/DsrF family protein
MRPYLMLPILVLLPAGAIAGPEAFTTGPVIAKYGPAADVDATLPIPAVAMLRHSFDVSERAGDGEPNRTLVSAARFINMHARAGVDADRIRVAVVVHGKAVFDVSGDAPGNADLVAALLEAGARIIVCGQSAVYYDVATADLLPGVEMALSAMTAHALLQQQGFTLNPF